MLALAITGWCAIEIRSLRARLESDSRESRVQPQTPTMARPAAASVESTNTEQRLKKLEAATPGLGDVMAGLQLHLAKLYFASEARNWDLARFECGEIEEGLNHAAALRPEERGVGLAGIIDAFKNTQLVALKDAIDVKDRGLLREAYQQSILMCNGCHAATGRPFINMTVPTNPPVSNQRWEPPPEDGK